MSISKESCWYDWHIKQIFLPFWYVLFCGGISQKQTTGVNLSVVIWWEDFYFNESDLSCVQILAFAVWYAQKFNQMLNYILTWDPNSWLIPLFLIKEITKIKFNIAFTYSSKRKHLPISFSHLGNSCLFNTRDHSF